MMMNIGSIFLNAKIIARKMGGFFDETDGFTN